MAVSLEFSWSIIELIDQIRALLALLTNWPSSWPWLSDKLTIVDYTVTPSTSACHYLKFTIIDFAKMARIFQRPRHPASLDELEWQQIVQSK